MGVIKSSSGDLSCDISRTYSLKIWTNFTGLKPGNVAKQRDNHFRKTQIHSVYSCHTYWRAVISWKCFSDLQTPCDKWSHVEVVEFWWTFSYEWILLIQDCVQWKVKSIVRISNMVIVGYVSSNITQNSRSKSKIFKCFIITPSF